LTVDRKIAVQAWAIDDDDGRYVDLEIEKKIPTR